MSTHPCAAFGTLAERFAHTSTDKQPIIVFDPSGAAEALREALTRKFRGETFLVRPVIAREQAHRLDTVLPAIVRSFSTLDDRRVALDQAFGGILAVDGHALGQIRAYDSGALRLMQGVVRVSEGIVVSSQSERRRIIELLNVNPPAAIVPLSDPHVPVADAPIDGDAIAIWAPFLDGDAACAFVLPLSDLRIPLLLVSATPPTVDTAAAWVSPSDARHALKRARVIVDTDPIGCDAIRPLASWGAALVADIESGAHERFDDVRIFNRDRMASIFDAVASALSSSAPTPVFSGTIEPPDRLGTTSLSCPRVSVIIGTYDRPIMVREAIESIRRQTYPNIETVVVVDGGPRLQGLEDEFPGIRLIHMEENNAVRSVNTAFSLSTGEYIAMLNDDDVFLPDHIASLFTALQRSGCKVAHGDVVTAYLDGADGDWYLSGLESNMSRSADPSTFLVANQIGIMSCMFHRSCIENDMLIDPTIPMLGDYSLWVRLSAKYDFVHVEKITSCYTIRNRGAKQQSVTMADQMLAAYRTVYERFPAAHRPLIQRQREARLLSVQRGEADLNTSAAGRVAPVQWPLWSRSASSP